MIILKIKIIFIKYLFLYSRLEKYSFASLYTGKWGDASDDSEDLDRRTPHVGEKIFQRKYW